MDLSFRSVFLQNYQMKVSNLTIYGEENLKNVVDNAMIILWCIILHNESTVVHKE